jgi:hypothetical protein
MATLGHQLKATREAKGVSAEAAGEATKILTRMIVAMEADDFSGMAAPTYAKGFIRLYATYLGLNPEPLVEEYITRHAPGPKPLVDEDSQLEQNRRGQSALKVRLKWLPGKFNPRAWLGAPVKKMTGGLKPYVLQDIRAVAIGGALLLVLIVLIVSATNCTRRHTKEKSVQQPTTAAAARKLLDKPLPDLYLMEPGNIESSR